MTSPPPVPPMRKKEKSLRELVADVTVSHRPESDPPIAQELDRQIGRVQRKAVVRALRSARVRSACAAIVQIAFGGAVAWIALRWETLLHWLHVR